MLLKGFRVFDFGRFIAGPYCAALLGDHGADVVRIERIEGGEDRGVAPVTPSGEGGMYLQMNRNKRCLTLNLGADAARQVVDRIISAADVIVANLPPATLRTWGLDYERVRAINPRAVLTVATAYGSGGPLSHQPGFDTVGQAFSGAMHISGEPDQPVRTIANYSDIGTATACAMGTIAALWARERSGEGQLVEGSLLRTSLIHTNAMLIEQAVARHDRQPQGNRSFTAAPVDTFRTRSGWITVQVVSNRSFARWCKLVGQPELANQPAYASDLLRGQHGKALSAIMVRWCAAHEQAEALAMLGDAKIPAAPVHSLQQSLDDAHIGALGLLRETEFPGLQHGYPMTPHPVDMSAARPGMQRRAPLLGEHTNEVLSELGFSDDEIASMRRSGHV